MYTRFQESTVYGDSEMDRSVIDEWNDDFECFTGC